jgi:transposase-like protein
MMQEAVRLYVEDKLGAPAIAMHLGVGSTTVYRWLNERGVSRGSSAEGARRRGNRGRVYKHTPEVEREIVRRYEAGESLISLAEEYGYSGPGAMSDVVRRWGVDTRSPGATYSRVDKEMGKEILARFEAGESASAIADELPLTYQNVCRYLRAYGLEPNRGQRRGKDHPSYAGGRSVLHGYVVVLMEADSPFWSMAQSNGYVMEHRLVMAEYLGRPLQSWETVHHMDGDKQNNSIDNLALHIGKHGAGVRYRCEDCGSYRLEPVDLKE